MLDIWGKNKNQELAVQGTEPLKVFEAISAIASEPMLLLAVETRAPNTRARILSVNAAGEEMLQFTASRLYNQSFHQLIADSEDILNTAWQNYNFDLPEPWNGKMHLRTKDNRVLTLNAFSTHIAFNGSENFFALRFAPHAQLLKSQPALEKQIVEELQTESAKLEAVLRFIPAAIFRIEVKPDGGFQYLSVNLKYEEMSGQKTENMAGKTPQDILPESQAQAMTDRYAQCVQSRKSVVFEEYLSLPIGQRWWQTMLVPIADETGAIVEIAGVSHDITDRKNAAVELATKIDQQAAIAELGQLALTQMDRNLLLSKAVEIVGQALNAPLVRIEEYSSEKQALLPRAQYGWPQDTPQQESSIWDNTPAAAALKTLSPVAVEDFNKDSGYSLSVDLREQGVKSGLFAVISGLSGPFGILSAHETTARNYDEDQIYFLQAAADTIASAIKNNLSEQALRESERLVSSILDAAQIGIGVSGEDGRFVRVNQAFANIFGYAAKELLGREFTLLLPSEDAEEAKKVYAEFMKTGIEQPGEGVCLRKDGTGVAVQITAGRVRRADGSMLRVTTVEDISKRKEIESSLRQFQLAALSSHDALMIVQPFGEEAGAMPKIIFGNAAAQKITGYSVQELLGRPASILFGNQTPQKDLQQIQAILLENRNADLETMLHRKDGSTFWAQMGVVPVQDTDGSRTSWLLTLRDISDRKQHEAGLHQAKEQADVASRAKSDFLAGVSHEIRTPLNAIIGFADVIRRELFGPLGHERYMTYAQDIHDSGRHMLQLINNTLDLSKIEAGVLDLHESDIPIDAVIRSSVALLRDNAQKGQITLETKIEENLPLLRGDETKVKQILLNMLSNAIKYTLPGGKIVVRGMMHSGGLALQVEDNGVGIAQDDIPKVMEKYVQAASEQNKHTQGTGLGIPVTKSLVELHQGELLLESQQGQGTVITAVFPSERLIHKNKELFPTLKKAAH